jgi:hypothetical protein
MVLEPVTFTMPANGSQHENFNRAQVFETLAINTIYHCHERNNKINQQTSVEAHKSLQPFAFILAERLSKRLRVTHNFKINHQL